MENKGYIIGLDASTTEIGYCIWDKESNSMIELDHLTLDKDKNLLEKVLQFKTWILTKLKEYPQINEMVIEEAFQRMTMGSRIQVLLMLAAMNFAYQYICHEAGLATSTILVQRARFNAFEDFKPVHKKKAAGKDQKEQMFDHVFNLLGKDYFPTKILSKGPRKGQEVPESFCMDISDSYVVCLGFLNFRKKEQDGRNKKVRKHNS